METTNPQSPTMRGAPPVCRPTPQSRPTLAGRHCPRSRGQSNGGLPMVQAPQAPPQPSAVAQGQTCHRASPAAARSAVAAPPHTAGQRRTGRWLRHRPLDLAPHRQRDPLRIWGPVPSALPRAQVPRAGPEPAGASAAGPRARRGARRSVAQAGLAADQKKARRLERADRLRDETGFGFLSRLAPTWAPVGRTPVLRRASRRRELCVFICLTLSGKLYKRHFTHAIGGEDVVLGLRHLRRQCGPVVLVWDRLNAHRAKSVTHYLASEPEIRVEWLPAYAPELNPEEQVHGNIKQHLRNATPETVGEIRRASGSRLARLRQRPDILLGFIRHAGLWVKELW